MAVQPMHSRVGPEVGGYAEGLPEVQVAVLEQREENGTAT